MVWGNAEWNRNKFPRQGLTVAKEMKDSEHLKIPVECIPLEITQCQFWNPNELNHLQQPDHRTEGQ